MAGLRIDPVVICAHFVVDAARHETNIVRIIERKT
jgi:ribulose 1,5-bisphosphate synthetase/thiazole synthase